MADHGPLVDELAARIYDDLAAAWQEITDELALIEQRWGSWTPTVRSRRLRFLRSHVLRLMTDARAVLVAELPTALQQAYTAGATAASDDLGTPTPVFSEVDGKHLAQIASDTYSDLLAATQFVETSTKQLVRDLSRSLVRSAIVTGRTDLDIARELRRKLESEGITAIVYKDGSRHGLADYTDMVMRTKLAETYQVAGLNQYAANGIEWIELHDGPGCGLTHHNDPVKANGLVLPLAQAQRYPLSHPRCRRSSSAGVAPTSPHQSGPPAQSAPSGQARTAAGLLVTGNGPPAPAAQARHATLAAAGSSSSASRQASVRTVRSGPAGGPTP